MKANISRREFLRLSMVSTAGAILASCVPQPPASPTTAPSTAPTTAPTTAPITTPTTVPPTPEKGTVHIFDYDPGDDQVWAGADKAFGDYFAAKYPNIVVDRELSVWDGFTERLLAQIAGGKKYDVIYGYPDWEPALLQNNVIGPIDYMFNNDPELKQDDFYDFGLLIINGKLYGLAWVCGAWSFWYDRAAVLERGMTDIKDLDNGGNWNYDAMYFYGKSLTYQQGGKKYYGHDIDFMRNPSVYSMMAWKDGNDIWNNDFSTCLMDQPAHITNWEYIQSFYKEGIAPMPGALVAQYNEDNYAIGYTKTIMGGAFMVPALVAAKSWNLFKIGMARVPLGSAGSFGVCVPQCYFVAKTVESPYATWAWYKERSTSTKMNELYEAIGTGRYPPLKSMKPIVQYDWEDPDVYVAVRNTMKQYQASPKESQWASLFNAAYDEMILAKTPVETILKQLAEQGTKLVS